MLRTAGYIFGLVHSIADIEFVWFVIPGSSVGGGEMNGLLKMAHSSSL